ncbi:unnamed protein product [Candidula unifasciata]|uniref:Glycosyltransferase family 92 protein n=1 Tax=Candidula unifasciata TaxID=100452 RepID=A0A8S3ZLV6_9EUPU|nr:unnamed protein product [Candidula unifasciata]
MQCSLPVNKRPTHVSVSFQGNKTATNRLQIIYPGTLIRNFTVCYSVLHSGYKSTSQLIQSLEMNQILGAEHFVVYNYSISPAVDQILQRYQQDGLVTVLPWPLPTKQSWYYGQMSALNDCVYRNRNISRFVVVVDTDEFVMPKNHSNWMEMIAATSPQEYDVSTFVHSPNPPKKASAKTGCFIVRSSFFSTSSETNWTSFPPEFPFSKEEKNNTIKYNILVLHQLLRSSEIYRAKVKSKYIARPELTHTCGIHFVHTFTYFMRCSVVSHSIALVHHYRKPTMKGGIMDTTMLRFKSQLYPRVLKKYKLFPKIFSSG